MGIYDRDYYRQPQRSPLLGFISATSATTWLLGINIAVFLLDRLLANNGVVCFVPYPDGWQQYFRPLEGWGHFSAYMAISHLQLWRFITFQFLHLSPMHLFFNMLALFFFGPMVESYLGTRRFVVFYLICGAAGAVSYLLLWATHILVTSPYVPLIGASAGIFGILIAAASVAPNATVLIYGVIPMRMRTMALIMLAVAAYNVISQGNNAGGDAAHLGGAAAGFLLMRSPRLMQLLDFRLRPRMR